MSASHDLKKEQLLHKVVATSGFLFALCILPVAQYLLVNGGTAQNNSVAGISTDTKVVGDVPQSQTGAANCAAKKQQSLDDITTFYNGKKAALLSAYQAAVKPYQDAEAVLTGTPESIASEKTALDKLINDQYVPYTQQLAKVDAAVETARNGVTVESCDDISSPIPAASPSAS